MSINYEEELKYFLENLEKKHIYMFSNMNKEEIEQWIMKNWDIYIIEDELSFIYFLRRLLKQMNGNLDPHTKCYFNNNKTLPIKLKIINGNMYSIDIDENYKNSLYKKIVKVNNIPIESIIEELTETISYSTEGWKIFQLEKQLSESKSILFLPSCKKNDEIIYQLENGDKIAFHTKIDYNILNSKKEKNYEWKTIEVL